MEDKAKLKFETFFLVVVLNGEFANHLRFFLEKCLSKIGLKNFFKSNFLLKKIYNFFYLAYIFKIGTLELFVLQKKNVKKLS